MTATVAKVRAADLLARLRRHYIKPGPLPGGIFLAEVGLNGPSAQRRCDAVHVGFTSSSGRILTGHEIKVSRSDWLHELDQSGKADRWADQCHAWYVVAPSTLIVKPEELPHGWGLMVPNARTTTRMDITVRAAVREDHAPSWLIVRSIMARYDTLRAEAISTARYEAQQQMHDEVAKARSEFAIRGAAVSDGTVDRVTEIVRRVRAECIAREIFESATDDEIVAALLDHVAVRSAASQARAQLRQLVRQAEGAVRPFGHAYGELAKLLAETAALA